MAQGSSVTHRSQSSSRSRPSVRAAARIATTGGVEAACITSGASAGLTVATAALMARGRPEVLATLPDVAAAIANNDYVTKAGIDPETAIAADSASDESALPYVNVFAVRSEDVDNEVLNKLVEIYQTNQDVQDGVLEVSGGTA